MDEADQIQRLENIIQVQAEEIEHLRSRGLLGFFQRRRLRKMYDAGTLARRLREDVLRGQVRALKAAVAALQAKREEQT